MDIKRHDPVQLGGIGEVVARKIEEGTGRETRVTVLGHVQRGGSPTPYDRILSTKFGCLAAELAAQRKFGRMVALKGTEVRNVSIEDAIARQKLVRPDTQAVHVAREVGISFGEEGRDK
jgi:6-phosphofructokinase 1